MSPSTETTGPRRRLAEMAARDLVPLGVHFELTRACNLTCYHCYVVDDDGRLPTARWLELVDEVAGQGCLSVTLTGGEVMLHPDWLEIARAVRQRRMLLSVFTNGTLLDEASMDALARLNPMVVAMSVYGSTPATHDAVTGVPGSFEKTRAALVGLVDRGVRCRVSSVLLRDTVEEYPRVKALADELGCRFTFDLTVSPDQDGDCGVTAHRISDAQLREVLVGEESLLRLVGGGLDAPRGRPAGRVGTCNAGRSRAWIGSNGDLLPCMGLPSLGSLRERRFGDLWRSGAARRLRERLATAAGACVECELAHWCTTWCPRIAMVEDGDMSGASRRACRIAAVMRERCEAERVGIDDGLAGHPVSTIESRHARLSGATRTGGV